MSRARRLRAALVKRGSRSASPRHLVAELHARRHELLERLRAAGWLDDCAVNAQLPRVRVGLYRTHEHLQRSGQAKRDISARAGAWMQCGDRRVDAVRRSAVGPVRLVISVRAGARTAVPNGTSTIQRPSTSDPSVLVGGAESTTIVGNADGNGVGTRVHIGGSVCTVGTADGIVVGTYVHVGSSVGVAEGAGVGSGDGAGEGKGEGKDEGNEVGVAVTHGTYPPAKSEGAGVGSNVGVAVVGL